MPNWLQINVDKVFSRSVQWLLCVVFSVQGGGVVCYVIFVKVHSKQRYAFIKIKAKPFF